jgi:hypothetical protein
VANKQYQRGRFIGIGFSSPSKTNMYPSTEIRLILVILRGLEYFSRHDGGIKASQRMFSVC